MKLAGTALFLTSLLLGCRAGSSEPIQCPTPETGAAAGTIRETPAQIAEVGQELHHGGPDSLQRTALTVRARHPGTSKGAVMNYLITAYCPGLNADRALNQASRSRAMSTFAKQAEAVIY